MRDIGKNIRALRQQKHLTQEEFAEKLFVTRQTVSNYENGRSRPDIDTLEKIAGLLGTDLNALIYGPPVPGERKKARRIFWFGVGITAVLALALAALYAPAKQAQAEHYSMIPMALCSALLRPLAFLTGGWALMHGVSLLTAFPVRPWMRGARYGLWALLILLWGSALVFPLWISLPGVTRGPGWIVGMYGFSTRNFWLYGLLGAAARFLGIFAPKK